MSEIDLFSKELLRDVQVPEEAQKILDDCTHAKHRNPYECCGGCDNPCRACVEWAVKAAYQRGLNDNY